uniref:Nicotinic acetylcholine receptor subunit alpha 12 n=1 Tax=Pandalus japonicus TaxID=666362 RepID=R4JUL7_PANJP|nr:nicotinic acetylcholine receptor subunit alpha 12 [Pandalus japonicus]
MKKLLCLISLLLVVDQVRSDDSYARAEEALRSKLLDNYNRYALPDKKTVVTFTGLEVREFTMKEKEHEMQIYGWLKHKWDDPRLQWEASDHSNIQQLGVDPESIWKPDLSLYNAEHKENVVMHFDSQAIIFASGNVLHVPPCNLRFHCIMDLTYWPHDVHNCTLKIGSWIHSGLVLDIVLEKYEVTGMSTEDDDFNPKTNLSGRDFEITDWNVQRSSKFYDCCTEPYVSVTTSFIVRRIAPAYDWTVKLPVVCLCLLTLVLFMLPPGAGEKVLFGGVCLILDFLYLNYVTNEVNHAPTHTPLIVQLLGQQIVLVLASVFVSAIVLRMAKGPHNTGLPLFMKGSITGLAKFLLLGNYINDDSSPKSDDTELGSSKDLGQSASSNTCEWIMLAAIVDRLSLILYLSICIITLIRFNSVL